MFRDEEDLVRGFNCIAEASLETESRLLADGELVTHVHLGVCTDDPGELVKKARRPYAYGFNAKYHRNGRLGDKHPFVSEMDGVRHITAVVSYINRQGLHHGLSATAFGYPHCSANVIFQKELGKRPTDDLIKPGQRYKYLSRDTHLGQSYRMASNGLLLREDIIDISYVEELYVTPRGFLFNMTRQSGTDWVQEQKEEASNSPVVTLEFIEQGSTAEDLAAMKNNEHGRPDKKRMTDLELCRLIDKQIVPGITGREDKTIYDLPESLLRDIGNTLWKDTKAGRIGFVTSKQISRCLGGL